MITVIQDPYPDFYYILDYFEFSWMRHNIENPITKNKIPRNLLVCDGMNMIIKNECFDRNFYKRLYTILKDFS